MGEPSNGPFQLLAQQIGTIKATFDTIGAASNGPFQLLAQQIVPGGRLLLARPLTGGASAQVTALDVRRPGGSILKTVVRIHGDIDYAHNPNIAADEFLLLQLLHRAGFPTPEPLYLEPSGALFGRPCLVTTYIDGSLTFDGAGFAAAVQQLAGQLARLHHHPWNEPAVAFLPRIDGRIDWLVDGPLAWDNFEAIRIRAALRPRWPDLVRNRPTLLHGDYWPGNILWKSGYITAVLDWEDAAWGDPLMDLAIARLDLLFAHGAPVMDAFTEHYLSLAPALDPSNLPFWDLCADLRIAFRLEEWFQGAETVERNRTLHRWFMEDALARLTTSR